MLDSIVVLACLSAFIFGLYLAVFRRGRRLKGLWTSIGAVFAVVFWVIYSQDQAAISEGWPSSSVKMEAAKAGITDPAEWAAKQAALTSAERERIEAADADRRRKGLHCLSSWDGGHDDATRLLKANLRDPDSFDLIETLISPVDSEGNHAMSVQYRARNGFGGMNVALAVFIVRSSDCRATLLSVE